MQASGTLGLAVMKEPFAAARRALVWSDAPISGWINGPNPATFDPSDQFSIHAPITPSVFRSDAPPRNVTHVTVDQVRAHVSARGVLAQRVCYRLHSPAPARLRACDHQIPKGYALQDAPNGGLLISLRLTAPQPADNHHSGYEWSLGRVSRTALSTAAAYRPRR
jgi:hypothetical protein